MAGEREERKRGQDGGWAVLIGSGGQASPVQRRLCTAAVWVCVSPLTSSRASLLCPSDLLKLGNYKKACPQQAPSTQSRGGSGGRQIGAGIGCRPGWWTCGISGGSGPLVLRRSTASPLSALLTPASGTKGTKGTATTSAAPATNHPWALLAAIRLAGVDGGFGEVEEALGGGGEGEGEGE